MFETKCLAVIMREWTEKFITGGENKFIARITFIECEMRVFIWFFCAKPNGIWFAIFVSSDFASQEDYHLVHDVRILVVHLLNNPTTGMMSNKKQVSNFMRVMLSY